MTTLKNESKLIIKGLMKTKDGTEVIIDEFYQPNAIWIGHIVKLGEGHPQGVVTWNKDGTVANYGADGLFREKMRLLLSDKA